MKTIEFQETLQMDSRIYIDVRSPKEFKEATIPGAVNIPIFNDQERKEVGRVYTQKSPDKARMLAVELVSPKIPDLIKEIKALAKEYENLILFCSRGNLRSESLATFCTFAGIDVLRLKGGYKSYRHYVLKELENYNLKSRLLVIHGFTGVGKTDLLYKLKEEGIPIIDLEGLANHRGSAFGSIGLGRPTNQKQFDSLLLKRLNQLNGEKLIAVEAESKRIGISVLPNFFIEKMKDGVHALIESSLERRIDRIYNEYVNNFNQNREAFITKALESISSIKKHIIKKSGKKCYNKLINHCQKGELKAVIEILLINYYDPLYKYSQNDFEDFNLTIKEDELDIISSLIEEFIYNY